MASVVCSENWACINKSDEFDKDIGVSEIGSANFLIMSLMGELQDHVEESDEERLNIMIQTLEAEIYSTSVVDYDRDRDQSISDAEDYSDQSWSSEQMDGCDYSISFDDLDMENELMVDMQAVPCSPSNDLDWYTYPCGHEMISHALEYDQENGYCNSLY